MTVDLGALRHRASVLCYLAARGPSLRRVFFTQPGDWADRGRGVPPVCFLGAALRVLAAHAPGLKVLQLDCDGRLQLPGPELSAIAVPALSLGHGPFNLDEHLRLKAMLRRSGALAGQLESLTLKIGPDPGWLLAGDCPLYDLPTR